MRFSPAIVLLTFAACALAPQSTSSPLAPALVELAGRPQLAGGRIGVCVVDAADGAVLAELSAGNGFAPASNLKLISGAVALVALGPDHRFTTELAMHGELRDGVLHGDLLLRGRGDPTLGVGRGAVEATQRFVDALRQRGVQRVTGGVVGDDRWLGAEHLGHGWQWDYLDEDYAAPFGALCWNGNVQRVVVRAEGAAARVEGAAAALPGQVELVPAGGVTRVVARRELGGERIHITGTIAADAKPLTLAVTVPDPTRFAARELAAKLRAAGLAIGEPAASAVPDAGVPIAEWRSPPLAELLVPLLRDSDNLYAEQFHRVAARVATGAGDGAAASKHAVAVLQTLGVDGAGLVLADGSGLSRRNLVQPRQLARLLVAMERSPQRAAYWAALPVAGATGTLRSRFVGTAAAGRVRAKTGTIDRVACLSGYVPRANAAPIVFSIMLNDFVCCSAEAREAIDAFVLQLVAFADAQPVRR